MAKNEYPEFTVVLQDGKRHDVTMKFSDAARYDLLRASIGEKKLPPLADGAPISMVGISFIALKRTKSIEASTSFETFLNDMFDDLEIEEVEDEETQGI